MSEETSRLTDNPRRTLRDEFAMAAVPRFGMDTAEAVADFRYEEADAMMKRREEGGAEPEPACNCRMRGCKKCHPPSPRYRILEQHETLQEGDEWTDDRTEGVWVKVAGIGEVVGETVLRTESYNTKVRRKVGA